MDAAPGATLKFAIEPSLPLIPEMRELAGRHFDEIAVHKALYGGPNPDIELYKAAARSGALRAVTARDGGLLVGYFVFAVKPKAHYKHITMAIEDLYFLAPEYRKGMTGYRFLAFATQKMAESGADVASLRTKIGNDHGKLLERLGFHPVEVIYEKVLKHG